MNELRSDLVSKSRVGIQAAVVADLGVGRHLSASFLLRPIFGVTDQLASDAAHSMFGLDEPAFEISNVVGVAIFDEWPDAGFQESDQPIVPRIRNQNELRFGVTENVHHFRSMIAVVVLVPKQFSEPEPFVQIRFVNRTHVELFGGH